MRHSRYKYFSRLDYANQFLDGKVFHQTAAYFRDYEDRKAQQIIGDEYEGTRIFRPANGLEVNNLTRGINGTLQMGMESVTKAGEIYVFCVSLSFNDLLKEEFDAAACVEICDPRAFISRWKAKLPERAKADGNHVTRRVAYYRPGDLLGNVYARPDLIITTKLSHFQHQNEYRFAYTTTDAFAFQNCTYRLVEREKRPDPKPDEHHHETLDLGDLRDICKLHRF